MSKKVLSLISAVLLSSVMGQAYALDGAALFKDPKKGGCTACHGKDAKSPIMPMYPKLAGQNEAYLLQQLKDIKSGKRNNGMSIAMKGIMHMVNEEEMAAIAKYLSSLKP
ncbi:MAG: cytochrome c [Gammaproteobacteria bacterium]|nr:cytochrome c [Gammaproteobacteria bacterium]